VNHSLFDQEKQTLVPDLVTYLTGKHAEECQQRAETRQPVQTFAAFARSFLDIHRPAEIFAASANVGIVFDNGDRVVVCPNEDTTGMVNTSGAVLLT